MRGSPVRPVIGLMLALFLAAPPAFCWDCCCSTRMPVSEPVVSTVGEADGHGCCPAPAAPAEVSTAVAAVGCGCAQLDRAPYEAPVLRATGIAPAAHDSKASFVALVRQPPSVSPRSTVLGGGRYEPPLPDGAIRISSPGPRAPPAVSC